jgi:hypothetical protein
MSATTDTTPRSVSIAERQGALRPVLAPPQEHSGSTYIALSRRSCGGVSSGKAGPHGETCPGQGRCDSRPLCHRRLHDERPCEAGQTGRNERRALEGTTHVTCADRVHVPLLVVTGRYPSVGESALSDAAGPDTGVR